MGGSASTLALFEAVPQEDKDALQARYMDLIQAGKTEDEAVAICRDQIPLKCEEAMASGKVKTTRLASLSKDGKIVVKSIDFPINDETFREVGICSYTWGFERKMWYDEETGLTWEIADRAEEMCRAALQFFPMVWIDGLCMVQRWPAHISANMKDMGKLYWHGTVIPEMVLDKMAPEYPFRGWVQQEISFTNLTYSLTPLRQWFESNIELVNSYRDYTTAKKVAVDGVMPPRPEGDFPFKEFDRAVNMTMPFLAVLSRATEGRTNTNAVNLQASITKLNSELQKFAFMHGQFGPEVLEVMLELELSLTGRLEREPAIEGLQNGALQSFRTGAFRYNTDRIVAAFSLATYVAQYESNAAFLQTLDDEAFRPHQRQYITVSCNPGRWCTGLAPVKALRTAAWPNAFQESFGKSFDLEKLADRDELDLMMSILYNTTVENMRDNYDYVVGWERLDSDGFNSCHMGVQRKRDAADVIAEKVNTNPILGFQSANVPLPPDGEAPNAELTVNVHIKMELGMRYIALLNSSAYVHSLEDSDNLKFPTDAQTLRMLDMLVAPPFGAFCSPMKKAMRHAMLGLGAATVASNEEAAAATAVTSESHAPRPPVVWEMKDWGISSYEHVQL